MDTDNNGVKAWEGNGGVEGGKGEKMGTISNNINNKKVYQIYVNSLITCNKFRYVQ